MRAARFSPTARQAGWLFEECSKEFGALAGVNNDPMAQTAIGDLVYAAHLECDAFEAGETETTKREIAKIKRFIKKWEGAGSCVKA